MNPLFQRYTQVDNSTARQQGGGGLGLAIRCQLMQHMGGSIQLHGQPGQGSILSASIGCNQVGAAARTDIEPAAAGADANHRLRILAAEDNSVNQLLIQAMLESLGHQVEIVANGALALQRAQDAVHDLILMDMQMPEMDGVEAARAIRRLHGPTGRIPIVAMTANARAEDRKACLDAGMDDYVSKPIHLPTLQAALLHAMRHRAAPNSGAGTSPARRDQPSTD